MHYIALLVLGLLGFIVTAAMGGHRSGKGGGRAGKFHAKGAKHHAKAMHAPGPARWSWLFEGFSPLDVMALAVGAGAAGLVGQRVFADERIAAGMAVAGALLMNYAVVKPIFRVLLQFASEPALGLEGMAAKTGVAASNFDSEGRGLVGLHLDGQMANVLARLTPDERQAGVPVRKGDSLLILEVDAARSVCIVSKEFATPE